MKKIQAYSIIELIVVMLISSLVMSFCYTALEFTTERNRAFEQKQEILFEHESFLNQFQKDLLLCDFIQKNGSNIILHFDSTNRKYGFGDSITFQVNEQVLSFKVRTGNPEFYFLKEPQNIENGYIDQIMVPFIVQTETKEINFIKTYGADVLLSIDHERN